MKKTTDKTKNEKQTSAPKNAGKVKKDLASNKTDAKAKGKSTGGKKTTEKPAEPTTRKRTVKPSDAPDTSKDEKDAPVTPETETVPTDSAAGENAAIDAVNEQTDGNDDLTYEMDDGFEPPEYVATDEKFIGDNFDAEPLARNLEQAIENEKPADIGQTETSESIETVSGAFADWTDAEDMAAENEARAAANALVDSEQVLNAFWENRDKENEVRELSGREKEKLAYYERQIEEGLKRYISTGKWLFAIWSEGLFEHFKSFKAYVRERWGMTNTTGAYDLMKAFRTWRLASSTETMTFAESVAPNRWLSDGAGDDGKVHDGEPVIDSPDDFCTCGDKFSAHALDKKNRMSCSECPCIEYAHDPNGKADTKGAGKSAPTSDADAPSQRAIEELGKLSGMLERGDLTEKEFEAFEKNAIRWLWETIGDITGGKATQKAVSEALTAFVEFAKSKAFEIDGEQVAGAAEFRITKGLFEQLKTEKQKIREMMDAQRKRLATPQERPHSEFSMIPSDEQIASGNFDAAPPANASELKTPHIYFFCSKHGWQKARAFFYGACQLQCGDVFGKAKDQKETLFNPKLTEDNPIAPDEAT